MTGLNHVNKKFGVHPNFLNNLCANVYRYEGRNHRTAGFGQVHNLPDFGPGEGFRGTFGLAAAGTERGLG